MGKIILIAVIAGLTIAPAFGQHEEDQHGHKHHVSMFLGNTHDSHGEDAFTVGLDYEFRVTPLLGVGALIEHAAGDINSTQIGAGVFLHPWRELRVLTAGANEHHHGEDEFVVKIEVMYDFWFSGWSISPTVAVDLLEGDKHSWIYGLGIGRGF